MPDFQVKCVLEIEAELGECPTWHEEDQSLYWIDIDKATINRFHPVSGKNTAWSLPAMPGCFALTADNGAVIAARDGIYDFDFRTGKAGKRVDAPFDSNVIRFNDGRADRQGRLWAGTLPVDFSKMGEGQGAFYRFDGKVLEEGIAPIVIANGTAFSPDGKIMYRAESGERRVYAYDYDAAHGTVSNERVFADIPEGLGAPDGANIDAEGGYWVALPAGPNGGAVARFTPDGQLDFHFAVPVMGPTMVAFGGPALSTLYITTGKLEHLFNQPVGKGSGNIFAVETPFRGVPETPFVWPT